MLVFCWIYINVDVILVLIKIVNIMCEWSELCLEISFKMFILILRNIGISVKEDVYFIYLFYVSVKLDVIILYVCF